MGLIKKRWLYLTLLSACYSNAQEEARMCVGASEFVLVDDTVSFEQAINRCAEKHGTLAVPFSQDEQDAVALLADSLGVDETIWLGKQDLEIIPYCQLYIPGLHDEDSSGGINPSRFQLLDTTSDNSTFFSIHSEPPWAFDQPNDSPGSQDCVV